MGLRWEADAEIEAMRAGVAGAGGRFTSHRSR